MFTRIAKQMTIALAALVLILTASNANAAPSAEAIQGAWITPVTDKDGNEGFVVLILAEDGNCQLISCDGEGKAVGSVDGQYSYENGVLTVTLGDKRISESVVSASDGKMVTEDGQGRKTEWNRAKKVQ